ncbi:MAG: hypothetical protein RXO65_02350 [Candidatus Nanopusillus acidilobi]
MDDELLDAIIASIFLIIVSLIGIYFPYIVTRIFGTHNPYLILEVAGFITYSTSEPGDMDAVFLVTNGPTFFYEFRIIPPIQSSALFIPLYNNNDFLVSIGICYVRDLWQQLADDALNSFIAEGLSYLPGLKSFGSTKSIIEVLNGISKNIPAIAKQALINFGVAYTSYTEQSAYLQYSYGNHNIWGDIFNALQSSVGPSLWAAGEATIMQVVDMVLDETLPPPADFVAGFAFNMAFSSAITLIQYWQATTNPYAYCYYNQFISQGNVFYIFPNGEYTVYQPYLTLSIYYNPNFTFYNGCTDYYLCNTSFTYIYNSTEESEDNIFKLDLGNINNESQEVFPEFIVISKTGLESGGSQYLNISVLSSET